MKIYLLKVKKFIISLLIVTLIINTYWFGYNVGKANEATLSLLDRVYLAGATVLAMIWGIQWQSQQQIYDVVGFAFDRSLDFLELCKSWARTNIIRYTFEAAEVVGEVIAELSSAGYTTYYALQGWNQVNMKYGSSDPQYATSNVPIKFTGEVEYFITQLNYYNNWAFFNAYTNYYISESGASKHVSVNADLEVVQNEQGVYERYLKYQVYDAGENKYYDIGRFLLSVTTGYWSTATVAVAHSLKIVATSEEILIYLNGNKVWEKAVQYGAFFGAAGATLAMSNHVSHLYNVKYGDRVYDPSQNVIGNSISNEQVMDRTFKLPKSFEDVLNKTAEQIRNSLDELNSIELVLQNLLNQSYDVWNAIKTTLEVGVVGTLQQILQRLMEGTGTDVLVDIGVSDTPIEAEQERDIIADPTIDPTNDYRPQLPKLNPPKFRIPFLTSLILLIMAVINLVGQLIMVLINLYNIPAISFGGNIQYGFDYIKNLNINGISIASGVSMVSTFLLGVLAYKTMKRVI